MLSGYYTDVCLCRNKTDWLKKTRHFLNQSEVKPKPVRPSNCFEF